MRIIISPAKKMGEDRDSFPPEALPQLLSRTDRLLLCLREMEPKALQALWKCSDALTALNVERLRTMDLRRGLTPAILAYEGVQYQHMAPGVMEERELAYLHAHLRILSGFYGILRPFDGVTPYRLEMQAKLRVDGFRDLYAFWGSTLADVLAAETGFVVDLASREYSRAVLPHLPDRVGRVSCTFGELRGDRVVENGGACKKARGQMVRWMAENAVSRPEDLRNFRDLGYCFSPERSSEREYVFIKGTDRR